MSWTAVEVIARKGDGEELPDEAIRWMLTGFLTGEVAPEQMSALLMAVVWRGLRPGELVTWTDAMVRSGERLDLSSVGRPVVDKHSSGGVGDKVSLVVAPIVAAAGIAVPKLSGRGLGHTGGTLDKLESIPGWSADVPAERFLAQLREVGARSSPAPGHAWVPEASLPPTRRCTRCGMSPPPSSRCRSSPAAS